MAVLAQPDHLAQLVPKAMMARLDHLGTRVLMLLVVAKEIPDLPVPKENPDQLAAMVIRAPRENQVAPALLDLPDHLAAPAKLATKDHPALLAPRVLQAKTPSTVLAHTAPRNSEHTLDTDRFSHHHHHDSMQSVVQCFLYWFAIACRPLHF